MSGEPALTTLFPAPKRLPFAGSFVFAGKLKLKQKAELQAWLDALPEPSARVRAHLAKDESSSEWPLSIAGLPNLLDVDYEARRYFLKVALRPFNPDLSPAEIEALVDDSVEDDALGVVLAAYGVKESAAGEPATTAEPAPADQKKSGDGVTTSN